MMRNVTESLSLSRFLVENLETPVKDGSLLKRGVQMLSEDIFLGKWATFYNSLKKAKYDFLENSVPTYTYGTSEDTGIIYSYLPTHFS